MENPAKQTFKFLLMFVSCLSSCSATFFGQDRSLKLSPATLVRDPEPEQMRTMTQMVPFRLQSLPGVKVERSCMPFRVSRLCMSPLGSCTTLLELRHPANDSLIHLKAISRV